MNQEVTFCPGVQEIIDGENRELSTRDLMIYTAIDEMTQSGPVDFNSNRVCERLNVKVPMVNHYFGSRDGLLIEATITAYRAWSKRSVEALKSSPLEPEKALRQFIASEIDWSKKMQSLAILIQYPLLSNAIRKSVSENHAEEMNRIFEYHLGLLSSLIVGMRTGKTPPMDYQIENYPRAQYLLKHNKEVLDSTALAWAIHGLALWHTESHTPTRDLAKNVANQLSQKVAVKNYIEKIVAMAKGQL